MKLLDDLHAYYEENDYAKMRDTLKALIKVVDNRVYQLDLCKKKIKEEKARIVSAHKVLIECSKELNLEEVEIRLNEIRNCQERIEAHQKYIDDIHK